MVSGEFCRSVTSKNLLPLLFPSLTPLNYQVEFYTVDYSRMRLYEILSYSFLQIVVHVEWHFNLIVVQKMGLQ